MANHKGSEGTVKIGANTIAEIIGWTADESANTIDDSELGDTWMTNKSGQQSWTASIECHWDETDTTGQGAMTTGTEVTLNLYPEGAASTDTYYTGLAIVSGIGRAGAVDGVVSASYSLTGNGALTESTV